MKDKSKNGKLTPTEEINNITLIVGKFVHITVEIEASIDLIIGNHFYNDDNIIKMYEFIFPNLTLRAKCEIFKQILDKHYNQKYVKYKNKIDLNKIREKRNKFAHSQIYYHTNKDGNKDYSKIEFVRYSGMKQGKDVIDLKKLDDDFKFFKIQLSELLKLHKEIYPSL